MMKLLISLCVMMVALSLIKAANLPGGYHELDPESDVVTSKTQVALDSIAQQYGSGRTLGMAKIESASSQIVAGVNYKIGMKVCEQDSSNDNQLINEACRYCDITMYQSLTNTLKVTKAECSKPGNLESLSAASLNTMK